MGEGTLPELKFEFLIQQDYLFMRDRAKVFYILASRTTNDEEYRNYLNEFGKTSSKNADELFQKYNLPNWTDNQLEKGPACTGYTDFMLSKANGEVVEALVALLPCTVLFQKIGEHLKQTGVKSNNSKYQKWIDNYSSLERRRGKVEKFICTIEKLVTAKNRFSLIKSFEQATQFEYDFWDDAYHLRK
jgi:thiaminase/transcriptional activator TenA